MSLGIVNVGKTPDVDLYFATVRPGGTIAFFDNWSFHQTVVGPAVNTWPTIAPGVALPYTRTIRLNDVYQKTWTASDPTGTYRFLFFATTKNALRDGRFDAGDVVAASTLSLAVTP
jgi:hypothetical protein